MKYFINDYFSDCLILQEYIEDIDFIHNRRRHQLNKNGGKTFSMLYGITPYSRIGKVLLREKDPNSNYYFTKARSQYPILMDIFEEFRDLHFPNFEFNSVTINKNLQCKEHKDRLNNCPESVMIGLGDYRGGLLGIRDDLGKVKFHETLYKLIRFDGCKYSHFTTDFEGLRYTLVFYNIHWSVKKRKNK